MRIIYLNSWFGKVGQPYFDFIKKESSKTDIFCLMEVSPTLFPKLQDILSDFNEIYEKGLTLKVLNEISGQAIFVNKKLKIVSSGKTSIYPESDQDVGLLQTAKIVNGDKSFWLGSVHGMSRPGEKEDTPLRIEQSNKILEFFNDKKDGPVIIGGDFNLLPTTKSVKMFEEAGYRNLIKDFQIENTRNRIAWEQFASHPGFVKQHFADYVFTSPEVKVKSFEVPYMEISDHLPQILECKI